MAGAKRPGRAVALNLEMSAHEVQMAVRIVE